MNQWRIRRISGEVTCGESYEFAHLTWPRTATAQAVTWMPHLDMFSSALVGRSPVLHLGFPAGRSSHHQRYLAMILFGSECKERHFSHQQWFCFAYLRRKRLEQDSWWECLPQDTLDLLFPEQSWVKLDSEEVYPEVVDFSTQLPNPGGHWSPGPWKLRMNYHRNQMNACLPFLDLCLDLGDFPSKH